MVYYAVLVTSAIANASWAAKEKLNIVQWVELLTKQFDSSTTACSWFLSHMAADNTWAVTIFLKCHVNTIRQMFHRLCIHVIQKLRDMEKSNYLLPWIATDPHELPDEKIRPQVYYFLFKSKTYPIISIFNVSRKYYYLLRIWIKVVNNCHYIGKIISFQVGMASPITRFLRTVLSLLETGLARPYLKHLTELFRFLYDFSKLGEVEESRFLLSINTISIFVEFYLKAIRQTPEGGHIEVVSDDDEESEDDIVALTPIGESNKLASLEKMVCKVQIF